MSLDHYWLFWLQNTLEVIQFFLVASISIVTCQLWRDWYEARRVPETTETATVYVHRRDDALWSAMEGGRQCGPPTVAHSTVAFNEVIDGTLWLEDINHNTIAVYAPGEWTHFTTEPQ